MFRRPVSVLVFGLRPPVVPVGQGEGRCRISHNIKSPSNLEPLGDLARPTLNPACDVLQQSGPPDAQRVMRLQRNPSARRCVKDVKDVQSRIRETEDWNAKPRVWKRKGSRAMPSPGGLHAKFGVACSGAQQWKSATADANVNKLRLKSEVGWQPEKWSRPLKPGSEIGSKLVGWTAASIRTGSPSTHPRFWPEAPSCARGSTEIGHECKKKYLLVGAICAKTADGLRR